MSNSNGLTGFLAGAAVGVIVGILFAPDKGSNTRKKIANKTGEITDSMRDSLDNLIDGVKETFSGAREEIEKLSKKEKININTLKNEVKKTVS